MTPFPHPAHRTGRADFRIRLSDKLTPLLSRATPSAVSEHSSELIGCPISRSFTTYCVCLELRSLPSTDITRLQRYYEPLRHPQGARPVPRGRPVGHRCPRLGASRVACAFLVHMLSPIPRRHVAPCFAHLTQPYQPSPIWQLGRPAHRPFRGLLGVHSRYGLHTRAVTVYRDTLSEGLRHFVTSMTAPVASGWSGCRVGLATTGKRRLFKAHARTGLMHRCWGRSSR